MPAGSGPDKPASGRPNRRVDIADEEADNTTARSSKTTSKKVATTTKSLIKTTATTKPGRQVKNSNRQQRSQEGQPPEQVQPSEQPADQAAGHHRPSASLDGSFSASDTSVPELSGARGSLGGPLPGIGGPIESGMTRNLVMATLATAVGASFQHGYNMGVVNTPERIITDFINGSLLAPNSSTNGSTDSGANNWYQEAAPSENQVELLFSLVVSIYCVGGCIGALATAFVADRFGRKESLFYNCLLAMLACPMMASSRALHSCAILVVGRFLIGINAGLNAGLAPLYINEIAPVNLRGSLGTIYQLVLTLSMLVANILGLPSFLGDAHLWPYLFMVPLLPAVAMMLALPNCCESPKYLLLVRSRELQAQQALQWLRNTADIQEEMDELRCENERTRSLAPIRVVDLWQQRDLRRAAIISVVIVLSQQLSGINAILFYSTNIFREAGLSQPGALSATLAMSAVNVLMTGLSMFIVDRAGRRTLHMSGLLGMALSCLMLGTCLVLNSSPSDGPNGDSSSTSSYLAVGAIFLFIIMFASGPGSIPWFLVGELFPSNARPLATSLAVAVNWLANFTVTLSFLPVSNVLGGYVFFIFAFLLILFYLFTYFKVPETRGATAEEISALFKRDIY